MSDNQDQKKSNAANHLMIFADNSSSMGGQPFATLQKAMHNLSDMLFDDNGDSVAFDSIQTIYYNNSMESQTTNTKDAFLRYIKNKHIQGITDFVQCIDYIMEQVNVLAKENQGLENNFSIIFLTDGCDTCNGED